MSIPIDIKLAELVRWKMLYASLRRWTVIAQKKKEAGSSDATGRWQAIRAGRKQI
jgi:hypothetical protein